MPIDNYTDYLENGATVAAYTLIDGVQNPIGPGEPATLADAQQGDRHVVGFWWMNDSMPHAFIVESRRQEGDEIVIGHRHGQLVLSPLPLYAPKIKAAWEQWRRPQRQTMVKANLAAYIAEVMIGVLPPKPKPGEQRSFRTLLLYAPVTGNPDAYTLLGVFAADEAEIDYYGNPANVHATRHWQSVLAESAGAVGRPPRPPLEVFEYQVNASELYYRRMLGPVQMAENAAQAAALVYAAQTGAMPAQ